jgi:hypothetical protein
MKKTFVILAGSMVVCSLHAQSNPGVAQADATKQQKTTEQALGEVHPGDNLPPLYEGESEDVGPQSVLRQKKTPWVRASVDVQSFYTDNMLYQDGDENSAGVAVTSLEAAFMTRPCITRLASYRAEVGYRHQFFNYFGNDDVVIQPQNQGAPSSRFDAEDFDFDSSTFFASLQAQTKHYQFGLGLDYTRLFGFEPLRNNDYDEFYSEAVPRWSVQRNIRVCSRSMVTLAYLGSYHFTDEDPPVINGNGLIVSGLKDDRSSRWEHTLLAAYTVSLPFNLAAQPYYRFQLNDFEHTDNYLIHTVGFSAGWYPCENFSVRGFVGYNWSDASNSRVAEYEKLDAGGGLTATFRF